MLRLLLLFWHDDLGFAFVVLLVFIARAFVFVPKHIRRHRLALFTA